LSGTNNNTNSNNGSASTATSFPTALALRERFVHLMTTLTGQKVTCMLTQGTVLTGTLHTATAFSHLLATQRNKYVLKAIHVDFDGEHNTLQSGQTVILDMKDIVQLHLKSIRMDQLVIVAIH
jgi:small nuclear ribonucleoprotein (snRNP)-like protein